MPAMPILSLSTKPITCAADGPVGVDALVLGQEADARQAEMEYLLLLLRRHLALDPDEALLGAQALAQLLGVDVGQHGGDQLDRLVLVDDAARLGEHRQRPDVGGENFAVAIEKVRARARGGLVGRDLQRLRRLAGRPNLTSLAPMPT